MDNDEFNNGNMPKSFGDWGAEYGWEVDPTDVNNANFPRDLGGWGRTKGEPNNANLPSDLAAGEMSDEEKADVTNGNMPKTMTFADFMVVDYTPGMGDYISYQSQKRKRGHYDTYGDSYEPEGDQLNEVLSMSQRRKRSMQMKRLSKRIALARKRAMRRTPSMDVFKKRARKQAINSIKKRLTRGQDLSDISPARRADLEKRIAKMKGRIDRIAMKLLPKVRKADRDRKQAGQTKD